MPADSSRPVAYNLGELEILVVEENQFLQRMLRGILREFNFRKVRASGNLETSFNMFKNFPADLILAGWSPGQSALKLLDNIRGSDSPNRFVPLIVVSAFTEEHHVRLGRDRGMTEFLALPVSPRTVYNRICAVIEHPRPFIRAADFFGPDRRRRQMPFEGDDRRQEEPQIELPGTGGR